MRGSGFVSGTIHRQSMLRGIGYVSNNDTNDYDNQMGDQSPDEGGMSILEFSIRATTSKEN